MACWRLGLLHGGFRKPSSGRHLLQIFRLDLDWSLSAVQEDDAPARVGIEALKTPKTAVQLRLALEPVDQHRLADVSPHWRGRSRSRLRGRLRGGRGRIRGHRGRLGVTWVMIRRRRRAPARASRAPARAPALAPALAPASRAPALAPASRAPARSRARAPAPRKIQIFPEDHKLIRAREAAAHLLGIRRSADLCVCGVCACVCVCV